VWSERALAPTDPLFAAAVAAIGRKLSRVEPLDVEALPPDRIGVQAALDAWAGDDPETWRREFRRFYEQHLGVHVRPDPDVNAVLRTLAGSGVKLAVWSAGPAGAVELLLAQLGVGRAIPRRCFGGDQALAGLAAEMPAPAVAVVADAIEAAAARAAGLAPALAGWREDVSASDTRVLASPRELLSGVGGAAVP
jgi:phosphoglycolate phosphatase-like HAD superfamily hydrolase